MGVGTCRRSVLLPSLLFSALVLICLVPRPAASQVLYGSILGDVKDSTEASVPGANVVITNKNTGLTRETVTDTAGHFNFPDLPAGVYAREGPASRASKTVEQNGSDRQHQQRHPRRRHARSRHDRRDGHRQRGATEAADRHGRGALEHSGRDGPAEPAPVPLGRNYQQMYRMLPGFAPPDQLALHPEQSVAIARVHGQRDERRPEQHAHRRRQHGATSSCRTSSSYVPTLESIEEVNVVTNSMDAEQGLAGGAAINVQTKQRHAMPSTDPVSSTSPTRT